ncbi:MAG: hypothetical protein E7639_04220 [Ruminococcaceae bacterium]|nr:hypothetical protein [Oscillospiraceae bacterium]
MAYEQKKAAFARPDNSTRPIYYFTFPSPDEADLRAPILSAVEACGRAGCGGLIPLLPKGTELKNVDDVDAVREMYRILLCEAAARGLTVGFFLDSAFENLVIRMLDDLGETSLHAKLLECKEYICRAGEALSRPLHEGSLLSLVAYSEAWGEIIDLRPFIKDNKLCWQVPQGNWVVQEYLAVEENECRRANFLSYEASRTYMTMAFNLFSGVLTPYIGTTLTTLAYAEIGFHGTNRRDWDPSFNKLFLRRFGFDPAPLYPALFEYAGKDTTHYKAMLMTVRASMIEHGVMEALQSFASELGLSTLGSLTEPKLTACSFTAGDAMLCNRYSPCALFDKSYLYGTNSVKIAAGAAYNFDVERVNGELFRDYPQHDHANLIKDAMNAFSRGVNNAALHLPDELTADSTFGDFVARVQLMLRGGRHVADIALLYPIYDLHSRVTLYRSEVTGYEYPETPADTDYMTLINAITFYAGHDLTVLHPKTMRTQCRTEGGVLYLDNKNNREQFSVFVLPSTTIISLPNLRMLKKFFDEGGKILATGQLPTMAFEYDREGKNDAEVQTLTRAIFGEQATNKNVMGRYCHNRNENGGEALFLYFNATTVDGTHMTKSSLVNRALNSFGVPFDVYIPGMGRFEGTGALNAIYPEFHTVGLTRSFPDGGMFTHIHKRTDEGDIYYFSNATDTDYNHHLLLRGAHDIDEWDPHTGNIHARPERFVSYLGKTYTYLRLQLPAHTSTFFVAVPVSAERDLPEMTVIKNLESEQAKLNTEF